MIWSDVGLYKFIKFRKLNKKITKNITFKSCMFYTVVNMEFQYNFIVFKVNKLVTLESDE